MAFHYLSAFYPAFIPERVPIVPWWMDTPIGLLFDGSFWVRVFFVLSGFVLSRSCDRPGNDFVLEVVARYLRLAVPAMVSVLCAWALLTSFPDSGAQLATLTGSNWMQYEYQHVIPSFAAAVKDGLYGIFRYGISNFNNVLWTMVIEFFGSVAIYAIFQFRRSLTAMICMLIILALVGVLKGNGYLSFAFGSAIYLLQSRGLKIGRIPAILLLIVGLALGSPTFGFAARHGLTNWPRALQPGNFDGLLYPIGAAALIMAVLSLHTVNRFLSLSVFKFLAKVSFPLYLLHVPLLCTVFAYWGVHGNMLSGARILVLWAAYLVISLSLAYVFELYIDGPMLALSRRIRSTSVERLWRAWKAPPVVAPRG